jgi:hypothetical protein
LRVRTKIFLGVLRIDESGLTIFTPNDFPHPIHGQWYYAIPSFVYMNSGIVPRMAQYFDCWYQNGAMLSYKTQINASGDPNYVSWCFCDSPDHWERLGVASAVTTPTKTQILSMANSATFPAWTDARIILPPSNKKYYTSVPFGTGLPYAFATHDVADVRQTVAGTAGMRCDGSLPLSGIRNLGDIFLHLDITLCDMTGLFTTAPQVTPPTNKLANRVAAVIDNLRELKLSESDGESTRSDAQKVLSKMEPPRSRSSERKGPSSVRSNISDDEYTYLKGK